MTSRRVFKSSLPRPPVIGVILPQGFIDIFLKRRLVTDAVGDIPQLFVEQFPQGDILLGIFLKANISVLPKAAFFSGGR